MKKILLIVVTMYASSFCVAATWSGIGTIESVTSHDGYNIVITTINGGVCSTLGKFYWPISDPDAKDMLSIALTALSTQMQVKFAYSENTADCMFNNSAGLVTHVQITR